MSAPAAASTRDVLRLAWPATLSFLLNNAYRINDQYWVDGLGPEAHAAIGASTFVLIMNFGLTFFAAGGALPLVARATGSGLPQERDAWIRNALALGVSIGLAMTALGSLLTPYIPGWIGATGETAVQTREYLATIYLLVLPMVLAPIVDGVFIGMGNTRAPMLLKLAAVACNLVLNPILIYGLGPIEGLGIAGAALATCISRALVVAVGLWILSAAYGVRLTRLDDVSAGRMRAIGLVGLPVGLSVLMYAGVYWALMALVVRQLGRDVLAALGIGFNVFEGVSFPFVLGIAMAGSSLVGRNLGAGDTEGALLAVRNTRRVGRVAGTGFALAFWLGGPLIAPLFTADPGVLTETLRYVSILAWSQLFVAEEAVNEKVLHGAGATRPIFWISAVGNLSRIPLAYLLAISCGMAAAGVWWAINLTTLLKAALCHWTVERRVWLVPAPAARRTE